MTPQSLLDLVITTLRADLRCESIVRIETEVFSEERFFVKVRAQIREGLFFQVRIYCNRGHYDYSYALFGDSPITRWDNKEDCPGLENYPHHHHSSDAKIVASSLRGDPVIDLPIVVQELLEFIRTMPTSSPDASPIRRGDVMRRMR
jgi:hypothetical protein